jgi:energy coupling factor transporter S component ThiW
MPEKGSSFWSRLRVRAPPEYGIEPVPPKMRQLRFLDYFVLWSSLGVGLLVFAAGYLLVPGLSLAQAILAAIVGHLIGNLVLAAVGVIGSRHSVPTMVAVRSSFGIRGSYLFSALNVLQLIGWAVFEIYIMSFAVSQVFASFFGVDTFPIWAVLFGVICTGFVIGGPLTVVRTWLRKVGIWLIYGLTIFLTYVVFTQYDFLGALLQPGSSTNPMTFAMGIDLAIAMPLSWVPLVADFNRFAGSNSGAFWGTYIGFFLTSVWCYSIGAFWGAATGAGNPVTAIMTVAFGFVALGLITVDETDNAFADLYSAVLSTQNVGAKSRQWVLATVYGFVSTALAFLVWRIPAPLVGGYQSFLLLIGSVFIPLFGVVLVDYFAVRRGKIEVDELYRRTGRFWFRGGVNWKAILAWVVGFAVYHLFYNLTMLQGFGSSIPSLACAAALYALLQLRAIRQRSSGEVPRATPKPDKFASSRRPVINTSTAAILIAVGIIVASLSIPIPPVKIAPGQHVVNAIAGVLLGPIWPVAIALSIGIVRNMVQTGTLFAFPGGIPGGLIVGTVYWLLGKLQKGRRRKVRLVVAALSEPLGTVLIGATVSGLFLGPLLGSAATVQFFWVSFAVSSIPGSIIGALVLLALELTGVIRFYEEAPSR